MNQTVTLKTGEEVLTPLVAATMLSLKSLMEQAPIAFYELVMLVRDPQHGLFGNSGQKLREFNLLEADGQPHDAIRLIIMAATEGEGLDLKLVSPLRDKPKEMVTKATKKIRALDDLSFFKQMRRVADFIFEYARTEPGVIDRERPWMEDRRKESGNPYYSQTADGLFLELYYGMPSSLWTPWGKWGFGGSGSGSWNGILPGLLEQLGATLHQPVRHSSMGEFGPVYALHTIDDTVLPEPIELHNSAYTPYEEVNRAWKEMEVQFRAAKV